MADTTSKSLLRSYKYHHSTRSFAHSFLRKKFEASYVHFEENSRFAEPDFGKIDLRRKNASRCRTDPHVDYRMSLFTIHSQRPQQHIPGFFNFLFYASGVDAVNAGVWMCFRACLIVQCRCCHLGRRYDVARASRAYIQLKSLYPAQIHRRSQEMAQGPMSPKIFRISSDFLLWEAVSKQNTVAGL